MNKETALQNVGKIIKIKLKGWTWGNGADTPDDLEVVMKATEALGDSLTGFIIASDTLPIEITGDIVSVKYHLFNSVEIVKESSIPLFIGYSRTYSLLTKLINGEDYGKTSDIR